MEHIIDHFGLAVNDFARSKAFYVKALAPLGITALAEFEPMPNYHVMGFGRGQKPEYWIASKKNNDPLSTIHVCFGARSKAEVDAFYEAAIAAGGKDNGKPGIREMYHPNYYGAFVYDPDGNNVEAVWHGGR